MYQLFMILLISTFAAFDVLAYEALRPQNPQELLLGTTVDLGFILDGAEFAIFREEAFRRDHPQLAHLSTQTLKSFILKRCTILSLAQMKLQGIRFTVDPNFVTSVKNADVEIFRPPGYERAGEVFIKIPDDGIHGENEIQVDLKGLGLPPESERLTRQILEYETALQAQDTAAINAVRRKDHSDGLMSLGEALAEAARQVAAQILFDEYNLKHGTNYQTLETYFVIKLPINILKGDGESIPAAIYGRQVHWGRRYHFEAPEGTIDAKAGYIQQTFLGAAIDWGGVSVSSPEFYERFLAGGSLVDPQFSKLWGEAHDVARAMELGDAQAGLRWFERLFPAHKNNDGSLKIAPAVSKLSLSAQIQRLKTFGEEDFFREQFRIAVNLSRLSPSQRREEFAELNKNEQEKIVDVMRFSGLNPFPVYMDLVRKGDVKLTEKILEELGALPFSKMQESIRAQGMDLIAEVMNSLGEGSTEKTVDGLTHLFQWLDLAQDQKREIRERLGRFVLKRIHILKPDWLRFLINLCNEAPRDFASELIDYLTRNYNWLSPDIRLQLMAIGTEVTNALPLTQEVALKLREKFLSDNDLFLRTNAFLLYGMEEDIFLAMARAESGKAYAEQNLDKIWPKISSYVADNFRRGLSNPSLYVRQHALAHYEMYALDSQSNSRQALHLYQTLLAGEKDLGFVQDIVNSAVKIGNAHKPLKKWVNQVLISTIRKSMNIDVINIVSRAMEPEELDLLVKELLIKLKRTLRSQGGWIAPTNESSYFLFFISTTLLAELEDPRFSGSPIVTDEVRSLMNSPQAIEFLLRMSPRKIQKVNDYLYAFEAVAGLLGILKLDPVSPHFTPRRMQALVNRIEAIGNASAESLQYNLVNHDFRFPDLVKLMFVIPHAGVQITVQQNLLRWSLNLTHRNSRRAAEEALEPNVLSQKANFSFISEILQNHAEPQKQLRALRILTHLASQVVSTPTVPEWIKNIKSQLSELFGTSEDSKVNAAIELTRREVLRTEARCEALLQI